MTRGLVLVVLARADTLLREPSVWNAQRLTSACEKAMAGGAPRDLRTGERCVSSQDMKGSDD